MKLIATAAALALGCGLAGAAQAAEYVSIPLSIDVARPPSVVMQKTGGFCDIGAQMKTTCEITAGTDRELGAVRKIAGRVEEVLVAKTPESYTYAMTGVTNLYHGTVRYEPINAGKGTRIHWTLLYDISSQATPEAKQADKDRRVKTFTAALGAMKAAAES